MAPATTASRSDAIREPTANATASQIAPEFARRFHSASSIACPSRVDPAGRESCPDDEKRAPDAATVASERR